MRILLAIALTGFSPWCAAQQNPAAELDNPPSIAMPAIGEISSLKENFDTSGLGTRETTPLRDLTPPVSPRVPVTERSTLSHASPERSIPNTPSVPATGSVPASARVRYAESVIKDALAKPRNSRLNGVGVTLSDVVAASGSRASQSSSIAAYWDLCSTVSDYYLSVYEQTELDRLTLSSTASVPLQAARAKMRTRGETALAAARATQIRLATLMGRSDSSPLPLPLDLPLVGVYQTNYQRLFRDGGPREAAELNRLLPLRHAELLAAASAVAESEDWFRREVNSRSNDQGARVIKALELLALHRRAFVQITRDYNKRITRYTELARPGNLRTERLVAMLIKTDRFAGRPPAQTMPPADRRSEVTPPPTFRDILPELSREPRIDSGIMPASAMEDANAGFRGTPKPNLKERAQPDETSVLNRESAS